MVPGWFFTVPECFLWFFKVPGWFFMVSDGFFWLFKVPGWFFTVSGGSCCCSCYYCLYFHIVYALDVSGGSDGGDGDNVDISIY